MKEYIKERQEKMMKERKQWSLFRTIPITVINPFHDGLNTQEIITALEDSIPVYLFSSIEGIYIGKFKELEQRQIQAMFSDGVIYLSNYDGHPEVSVSTIVKNITHELAHSIENQAGLELYGDGRLESEYLGKMRRLSDVLDIEGFEFDQAELMDPEFDQATDDFLFKKVGYDNLSVFTIGLFASPYAATSLSEYMADGFEDYLLGDRHYLKKICPVLYTKIESTIRSLRA